MLNLNDVCCLCGKFATTEDPITREHVPPKQFYPKSLREGLNLWVVPTHRSCNNKYKADEEYFYHAMYPLVAKNNPKTAAIILDDLSRRAKKPQTPKLIRSIARTKKTASDGGILLPPNVISLDINTVRIQQIAIKIARCLFFRDRGQAIPYGNCKDICLCEREEDVPERYALSWDLSKVDVNELTPPAPKQRIVIADGKAGRPSSVSDEIFDYRSAFVEEMGFHFYTMRFWEAFMFCITFEEPINTNS